ncbi:hypothetical protein, partial [Paraburkholderia sp.]|uniref:hypothetical protein n=1 Tax=Paraburkholderia sp. TaxID=1926495 RepID=UPI00286F19FE
SFSLSINGSLRVFFGRRVGLGRWGAGFAFFAEGAPHFYFWRKDRDAVTRRNTVVAKLYV